MKPSPFISRTVVTFIALAVAGIIVAVSAQLVMDILHQTIMIGIGSALFGAALTFFLIRLFGLAER